MRLSSSLLTEVICVFLTFFGASIVANSQSTARKIAFTYGSSSSRISVINEDGSGFVHLTADGHNDRNPSWSPDGTEIVFETNRFGGSFNIFRMKADGTGLVPLTNSLYPVNNLDPAWSPDGTKISFTSNRDGTRRSEIWVMNADGTNLIKLTTNVQLGSDSFGPIYGQDFTPAWSPDGTKIAFSSTHDGLANPEIYSMNADGSNQVRLTNSPAEDKEPVWSHDGLRIAFLSQGAGRSGIYEIDATGANDHRITDSGSHPDWSPDGQRLAVADFDPSASSALAIYLMNSDGSNRVRVTNTGTVDSWTPTWQTLGGPAPPPPPGTPVYTVTGRVIDTSIVPSGQGVPGVTMRLSGTTSAVATTDANGGFFFGNLPENGNFTLTPSSSNWGLYPTSRSFSTSPPLIGFVGRNLDVQFDAFPIFLQFTSASYSGTEGSSVTVTVERVGFLTGTSTINYSTSDGTAVAGSDYVATSGMLQFNPFESQKSFSIPIIYDRTLEPVETINLTLSNPTGSIARGRQTASITISDPPPFLITQTSSSLAAALNAELWLRDPFPLTTTSFLGQNRPTRVALFARFVDLLPSEDISAVSVSAFDSLQVTYDLPVEFVGPVPGVDWLTQVNVRLPSNLHSGDLFVTVRLRGLTSNAASIRIQ